MPRVPVCLDKPALPCLALGPGRTFNAATRECFLIPTGTAYEKVAVGSDVLSGILPDVGACWHGGCTLLPDMELQAAERTAVAADHPGHCCELCSNSDTCLAW